MNKELRMRLCGRVCRDSFTRDHLSNQEKLEEVQECVASYFPSNAIHIHNQDNLLKDHHQFPEFYSALWLAKETNGAIKQTVLVVCANTISDANKKLDGLSRKVSWE